MMKFFFLIFALQRNKIIIFAADFEDEIFRFPEFSHDAG